MGSNGADLRYAGFWLRAIAAIVDLLVLGIALSVFVSFVALAKGKPLAYVDLYPEEAPSAIISAFGKPSEYLMHCFFVLSGWLYFSLLESSAWQATIGERSMFGLYVADAQGERATFARTSGRFFGGCLLLHVPYCGGLYFCVDCLCAGLTERKQAIHDLMTRCLVLRKKTVAYPDEGQ